jgi:uncharacterized protein (TIGR03000 family)
MRSSRFVAVLAVGCLSFLGAGWAKGQEPAVKQPVTLTFVVPDNGEVWIEGTATTMRGTVRQFISPAVPTGQNFTYTVRVRWQRNGGTVDDTREISVQAGDFVSVDYSGRGAGFTSVPSISKGDRAFYYVPGDELEPLAPRYNSVPRAPYRSLSPAQGYYGTMPGSGGPDTTW